MIFRTLDAFKTSSLYTIDNTTLENTTCVKTLIQAPVQILLDTQKLGNGHLKLYLELMSFVGYTLEHTLDTLDFGRLPSLCDL